MVEYIFLGIFMLSHATYMILTHKVSFGRDTLVLDDSFLYLVAIPYIICALSIMYLAIKNKGSEK